MTSVMVRESDAEMEARNALSVSSLPALRALRVEREGHTLVLTGRVNTFYLKQMAQEIVRGAIRGMNVINQIEVT